MPKTYGKWNSVFKRFDRITTAGYEYDLAGNLTSGQAADGSWQKYDYDTAGKLYRVWSDDRVTMLENNEYVISRQRELRL